MAKKVIRLTESELYELIVKATNQILVEIDGKTLSRVSNSAINSMNNIQNGVNRTFYGTQRGLKMIDHNKNIEKADVLTPQAIQSFLTPYKSVNFMFWAYRRVGNPVHFLFRVEDIKKLIDNVAILSGEVVLGMEKLPGDVVVEFRLDNDNSYTRTVFYKYKGNKYKYILEPNINTKPLWDNLVDELENCLRAKMKRGL